MQIQVLPSDKFFTNSPNAGDDDCTCSRCAKNITEDEFPLRMWSKEERLHVINASGDMKCMVIEYRYCESCQQKMGIK